MRENETIKKENLKMKYDFAALKLSNNKLIKENNDIKTRLKKIVDDEINPLKEANDELINENKAIKKQLKKIIDEEINPLKEENKNLKKHLIIVLKKQQNIKSEIKVTESKEDSKTKSFIDIDINKITIKEFNSLPLKIQQTCISKILSENKYLKYFVAINDLLQYLLKFSPTDKSSYFRISANDDDLLFKMNENNMICLLSDALVLLFNNRQLSTSSTFLNILRQFTIVSVEINYPMKNTGSLLAIVSTFKVSQKIEINVFITNTDKVDSFFQNKINIKSIFLDFSVTRIEEGAFIECSCEEIIIPESVSSIGSKAFSQCSLLMQIKIPCSIDKINDETFSGCTSLTKITIPASVMHIGRKCFYNCSNLRIIKFESFSTRFECDSFDGCTELTSCCLPSLDLNYRDIMLSYNPSSFNNYHGEIQCTIFNVIKILIERNSRFTNDQVQFFYIQKFINKIVTILSYISSHLCESVKSTPDLSYISFNSGVKTSFSSFRNYYIYINFKIIQILFSQNKSIPDIFNDDDIILSIKRSSKLYNAIKNKDKLRCSVKVID